MYSVKKNCKCELFSWSQCTHADIGTANIGYIYIYIDTYKGYIGCKYRKSIRSDNDAIYSNN